jgi:hypothetical protein
MQGLLHRTQPGDDIGVPLGIIHLTCVALHPLPILIIGTGPDHVLQVHIIGSGDIIAVFTRWSGISLHLPRKDCGIREIKRNITQPIFVSWRLPVTLIKNPIRVDLLPVSKAVCGTLVGKRSRITEKREVETENNVRVV